MTEPVGESRSLGITPGERAAIIDRMPFVTKLPKGQERCQGRLSRKRQHRRCSSRAKWRYTPAVPSGMAQYCTVHLFARGFYAWPEDMRRVDKWLNANMVRILNEIRNN